MTGTPTRPSPVQRTDPAAFRSPHGLRTNAARALWRVVWALLFRPSPPRLGSGWRRLLLRMFGARLGRCWIHPAVRVWAPWRLTVGSDTYVDSGVWIYNAFGCRIGDRAVVSMDVLLCSATHDYTSPTYELTGGAVTIGADCWIAARAFVGPDVAVGEGAVVGACAVVTRDVPPWTVAAGNPARVLKTRELVAGPTPPQP
jgi:putative colanic acid biosynthesis acetyltransferase WcaF